MTTIIKKFDNGIDDYAYHVDFSIASIKISANVTQSDESPVYVEILSIEVNGSLISEDEAFEIFNSILDKSYGLKKTEFFKRLVPSYSEENLIKDVKSAMRREMSNFAAHAAMPMYDIDGNRYSRFLPDDGNLSRIVQWDGVQEEHV